MGFGVKLSDRLSSIAIAIDSGNGEAQTAWQAAERIDELEARLRDVQAAALYMRSTLAQIDTLLRGELLFGTSHDLAGMAKIKAESALRVVAEMDFWTKGKK